MGSGVWRSMLSEVLEFSLAGGCRSCVDALLDPAHEYWIIPMTNESLANPMPITNDAWLDSFLSSHWSSQNKLQTQLENQLPVLQLAQQWT